MAAAASESGKSIFAIYYHGPQTYGRGRKISGIDLSLRQAALQYFAAINEATSRVQPLTFSKTTADARKGITSFRMTPEVAKTMKLSAGWVPQDEKDPLGSQADNLPIAIDKRPEFEPDTHYRVTVTNKDDKLTAKFKKVPEKASETHSTGKPDRPTNPHPVSTVGQFITELVSEFIEDSDEESELNRQLDRLDVKELKNRYGEVHLGDGELELRIHTLLSKDDRSSTFLQAIIEYHANSRDLIRLARALARKDVLVQLPPNYLLKMLYSTAS